MPTEPIEIEFTPTPEDVISVRLWAAGGLDSPGMRRVAQRRAVMNALIVMPLGAFAIIGIYMFARLLMHGLGPPPSLLAGLAVFVLVWAAQVFRAATAAPFKGAAARRLERIVRQTTDTSDLTSNLFRIDVEGVTHENNGIVTFFPWASIVSATRADDAWYLRASNETTLRIPHRVIPDDTALDQLIEESRVKA